MVQLIVNNLEDDMRDKLRKRAQSHGHSIEDEIRDILRAALVQTTPASEEGLGSQISAIFRDQPDLGDEPFDIDPMRGGVPEPMSFDE